MSHSKTTRGGVSAVIFQTNFIFRFNRFALMTMQALLLCASYLADSQNLYINVGNPSNKTTCRTLLPEPLMSLWQLDRPTFEVARKPVHWHSGTGNVTPTEATYVQNKILLNTCPSQSKHADHSRTPAILSSSASRCRSGPTLVYRLHNGPFSPELVTLIHHLCRRGVCYGKSTLNFSYLTQVQSAKGTGYNVVIHTPIKNEIGYTVCVIQDWTDHLWPAPGYSERPCEATKSPRRLVLVNKTAQHASFIFGLVHVKQ